MKHIQSRFFLILILITLYIILGISFLKLNIFRIPQYGDTHEYLSLSKTLIVDQYRGVAYPWIIHYIMASGCSIFFIYVVQMIVSILAIVFYVRLSFIGNKSSIRIILISSLIVFFNPLVLHFNESILTDSIAASLVMLFIINLVLLNKQYISFHTNILLYGSLFLITVILSLIRVEKLYLVVLLFIFHVAYVCYKSMFSYRRIFSLVMCFMLSLSVIHYIKKETMVNNANRAPLTISAAIFSRVVWPQMTKVYPYLTPEERSVISLSDAKKFDEHNNNVNLMTLKLIDQNHQDFFYSISKAVIEHFPLNVLGKILFDYIKYTIPIITFPLECLNILPQSGATSWTISRMFDGADTSKSIFQILYLYIGFCISAISVIIIAWDMSFKKSIPINKEMVLYSIVTILINSLMFTMATGMDSHIRYALPSYMILSAMVSVCFTYFIFL